MELRTVIVPLALHPVKCSKSLATGRVSDFNILSAAFLIDTQEEAGVIDRGQDWQEDIEQGQIPGNA